MHDEIEKAYKEIEKLKEAVDSYIPHFLTAEKILNEWPHKNLYRKYEWDKDSVALGYQINQLQGAIVKVNSENMENIKSLLSAFAKEGYLHNGFVDWPENQCRTWGLYKKDDEKKAKVINLRVFFSSESNNACRFVEEKKELKPVYKLVCPDGEQAAEQPRD